MAKIAGTVSKSDLEGGVWLLETAKGVRYQLRGELKGLRSGARVEASGTVEKDLMGFSMTGIIFTVKKIRLLDK